MELARRGCTQTGDSVRGRQRRPRPEGNPERAGFGRLTRGLPRWSKHKHRCRRAPSGFRRVRTLIHDALLVVRALDEQSEGAAAGEWPGGVAAYSRAGRGFRPASRPCWSQPELLGWKTDGTPGLRLPYRTRRLWRESTRNSGAHLGKIGWQREPVLNLRWVRWRPRSPTTFGDPADQTPGPCRQVQHYRLGLISAVLKSHSRASSRYSGRPRS